MAVTTLASLANSSTVSDAFTPTNDFFVAVEVGQVALEAKLPGTTKFLAVAGTGSNSISVLTQDRDTIVQVTPFMAGTEYRLKPQSRRATAKAYQEAP